MSALTKVFVVLHVVVSMLLVAGMVVFVNKVENFSESAVRSDRAARVAEAALKSEEEKVAQIVAEKEKAAIEAADRANVLNAAYQAAVASLASKESELATARADKDQTATQLTTAGTALKVAQDANAAEEAVNAGLRKQGVDLEKQYRESQIALSDLNNRLDSQNRELNYQKENVVALEAELDKVRKQIVSAPVMAPGSPPPAPGPGAAAPAAPSGVAIHGVVKSKFQVGELEYATVALGSADGVAKGTRFNVVDNKGQQFLGYLTIDSVAPNEASGHLNGPNVNAIQKGSEVLTAWQ